jgi:predicted aldo/keto reductase-like oxidoreductase
MSISRREFVKESAVVAGGLAAAPLWAEAADNTKVPLPRRVLGRTGWRASILGFGTAPIGSDNTPPVEFERIVHTAIDLGINYIDTAPVYGSDSNRYGNAETKLRSVLKRRREEVFLVTKVNNSRPDRAGVQAQLEESLKRMGVDHVDLVHLHNLGDFDMQKLFLPEGALAGLRELRRRGLTRYLGVSGHSRPHRFAKLIETDEIDLAMVALNFADRNTYDFEGYVLPTAAKHRTAVVAMKVLGGAIRWAYDGRTQGCFAGYHERAIRYVLGLPGVGCAVIGFASEGEVRQAVEVARNFKPLSSSEKAALLEEGKKIAAERGLYYGPVTG